MIRKASEVAFEASGKTGPFASQAEIAEAVTADRLAIVEWLREVATMWQRTAESLAGQGLPRGAERARDKGMALADTVNDLESAIRAAAGEGE